MRISSYHDRDWLHTLLRAPSNKKRYLFLFSSGFQDIHHPLRAYYLYILFSLRHHHPKHYTEELDHTTMSRHSYSMMERTNFNILFPRLILPQFRFLSTVEHPSWLKALRHALLYIRITYQACHPTTLDSLNWTNYWWIDASSVIIINVGHDIIKRSPHTTSIYASQ